MRVRWNHSGQVLAITHSTGKEARCQNYNYLIPTFAGRGNVKSELEFHLKHNSEAEVYKWRQLRVREDGLSRGRDQRKCPRFSTLFFP